uniref:Uncharacterized protein n=1 Tax=Mycena chlorophos TaxID=658473 RepID=A0ABQ0LCC2_MYCCL|nr:predicted protein [Mycena chlorophos]
MVSRWSPPSEAVQAIRDRDNSDAVRDSAGPRIFELFKYSPNAGAARAALAAREEEAQRAAKEAAAVVELDNSSGSPVLSSTISSSDDGEDDDLTSDSEMTERSWDSEAEREAADHANVTRGPFYLLPRTARTMEYTGARTHQGPLLDTDIYLDDVRVPASPPAVMDVFNCSLTAAIRFAIAVSRSTFNSAGAAPTRGATDSFAAPRFAIYTTRRPSGSCILAGKTARTLATASKISLFRSKTHVGIGANNAFAFTLFFAT